MSPRDELKLYQKLLQDSIDLKAYWERELAFSVSTVLNYAYCNSTDAQKQLLQTESKSLAARKLASCERSIKRLTTEVEALENATA